MKRADRTPGPDLDPLFAAAKVVEPIGARTRARALARARATAAQAPAPSAPEARRAGPFRLRFAMAVGLALVFVATGAVAAFLRHRSALSVPAAAPAVADDRPMVSPVRRAPPVQAADVTPPVAPPSALPNPERHGHPTRLATSSRVELALIQRAQEAYTGGNLPVALALLADHARRFPNGRFAEEREALRVRSLARCGRDADARRALQAFGQRFPQSVLLPRLREALAESHATP